MVTARKFPDADNLSIGKNIPILFGRKRCQLTKLADGKYLIPEGVTEVSNVYKSTAGVSFTADYTKRIITATDADS
jgi:hypothetical protein